MKSVKFIARSHSADRWANLTLSAPDSPECDGELLNFPQKESVVHIRAERTAEKSWIDERDQDLRPVEVEKEPPAQTRRHLRAGLECSCK